MKLPQTGAHPWQHTHANDTAEDLFFFSKVTFESTWVIITIDTIIDVSRTVLPI